MFINNLYKTNVYRSELSISFLLFKVYISTCRTRTILSFSLVQHDQTFTLDLLTISRIVPFATDRLTFFPIVSYSRGAYVYGPYFRHVKLGTKTTLLDPFPTTQLPRMKKDLIPTSSLFQTSD